MQWARTSSEHSSHFALRTPRKRGKLTRLSQGVDTGPEPLAGSAPHLEPRTSTPSHSVQLSQGVDGASKPPRNCSKLMRSLAPRLCTTRLATRGSSPLMCATCLKPRTKQCSISERTLKMYCYQFLDVVMSLASIYRNPFS